MASALSITPSVGSAQDTWVFLRLWSAPESRVGTWASDVQHWGLFP